MKLTVFGATGGVGAQLVRLALEQGHTVTAVVRNPAQFTLPSRPLHFVTVPDLADTERLQAAVAGSDAALSGVGPSDQQGRHRRVRPPPGTSSPRSRAPACERFVAVSAAPVGPIPDDEGFLNRRIVYPLTRRFFAGIYADLAVMEHDIARQRSQVDGRAPAAAHRQARSAPTGR